MPKRKKSVENIETCSEVIAEPVSSEESDYEPTAAEIAQAEEEMYYSDGGESLEELELSFQKAAVANSTLLYTSKDGKIVYESKPTTAVSRRITNKVSGRPRPPCPRNFICIFSNFFFFVNF